MAVPLQAILEAELAAGNAVAEISSWPPQCELLVILRHSFRSAPIQPAEVAFAEVNDGHYWRSEYRYKGGVQVLACGFS